MRFYSSLVVTVILTELEKIGRCMGSGEQGGREEGRALLYTGVAFAAARVVIKSSVRLKICVDSS